jgi:hypothetical protein
LQCGIGIAIIERGESDVPVHKIDAVQLLSLNQMEKNQIRHCPGGQVRGESAQRTNPELVGVTPEPLGFEKQKNNETVCIKFPLKLPYPMTRKHLEPPKETSSPAPRCLTWSNLTKKIKNIVRFGTF